MNFYIRKILSLITTILLVSVITFLVFQILPGDPVAIMLGPDADPLQAQAMRENLGLNEPLLVRYIDWIKNALVGDLGMSLRYNMPVSQLILGRIPVTFSLAFMSLILTVFIGLPIGIFIARKNDSLIGKVISIFSQLGLAIPSFWTGILLILLFSVTLGLLPSGDYTPLSESFSGWLTRMILPSTSIAIGTSAVLIRYLKTAMLDETHKLYVQTAYSKGLSERQIYIKHILKNALIPTITILGLLVVDILGGSIITENVFNIPGLGNLIVTSINSRDLPLIQGLVLYLATIVVVFNFLVDILYSIVDPRIRVR
ncbi:MAG: ABC transporter permease [Cellulosilyticaceae bacterium]